MVSISSLIASIVLAGSVVVSESTTPAQTPPSVTFSVPANLQSGLNQSAKVTFVKPGDHIKPDLEWTALGDSYAAGVGSTEYYDGGRCFRYDEPYAVIVNFNPYWSPVGAPDPVLPEGTHLLNFVACSGSESQDILDWQLLDKPTYWKPDFTYGTRPAFGTPQFATLTAGGDDVDFPGILFNCIIGVHIKGGPVKRTCTDQRTFTWGLINSGTYIDDLGRVIDAIMKKGRQGPIGDDFRLYMTGYARFFNADTTGPDTNCGSTTFQIDNLRSEKPLGPNGPEDAILTQDLRQEFNNMSDAVNAGIKKAIDNYNDSHVKFVDIQTDPNGDDILAGRRFCEKGVQEPDPSNPNLYMFHYPYAGLPNSEPLNNISAAFKEVYLEAYNTTWNDAQPSVNEAYPKYNQFYNAVLRNISPVTVQDQGIDDWNDVHIWAGYLGDRAKVFHPKYNWHVNISTGILTQYFLDHDDDPIVSPQPTPTIPTSTSQSPSPTSKVVLAYHSENEGNISWDIFTAPMARTTFDFCSPYTTYSITATPTAAASAVLPTGTFSIGEVGNAHQENGCIYMNPGDGSGSMSCDGVGGFDCVEIPSSKYPTAHVDGDCHEGDTIAWRIQCQW